MPKSSYLCRGCWTGLNRVQRADLKRIRRAVQEQRLHEWPMMGRG